MIGKSMNTNQRNVLLMSLSFVLVFAFVFGGLSGEVLASTQETNPGGNVTYENIPYEAKYEATVEVGEKTEETGTDTVRSAVPDSIYVTAVRVDIPSNATEIIEVRSRRTGGDETEVWGHVQELIFDGVVVEDRGNHGNNEIYEWWRTNANVGSDSIYHEENPWDMPINISNENNVQARVENDLSDRYDIYGMEIEVDYRYKNEDYNWY